MPSVVSAMTLSGATDCASLDIRQLLFRRGEDDGDRLDLGDRHNAGLGRGVDDVADVDLAQAGDARDRRFHLGIVELGLGIEDGRIVGRQLRGQLGNGGALGIGLLPGREFAELGVALQIEIGVGQIGLILRLLGLGLIERRLVGAGIDLDQEVALIDDLAFLEGDLVDLSVDPGPYHDGVETLHRSEPAQIDRKISFLDGCDGDANRIGRRFLRIARLSPGFRRGTAASRKPLPRRALRPAKPNGWSALRSCQLMRSKVSNGSSKRFPSARYNMRALYV